MSDDESKVIQTQVDVGVIKAAQIETNRRLSNIESKMDSFAFTKQTEFDRFKEEVAKTYATKEEVRPIIKLVWGIISLVITTVVIAGLAFIVRKP